MSVNELLPAKDIAKKCGRVAVLMGGTAAEREVSLTSGSFVLKALQDAGVDAFKIDIGDSSVKQLSNVKADCVFNILHGRGGEDGEIQGVLEALKIPYVGSSIKASALTMDKLMTKRLLVGCGISTPLFMQINDISDCDTAVKKLGLPLVIKPVSEGSSIGMEIVEKSSCLEDAFNKASKYGAVMAEQWMGGDEYTVAWMGGKVLPAIKLETPHKFYDYDAKYVSTDTRYICPCELSDELLQTLNEIVEKTVSVCELRHWGRVDLMMDSSGKFQVIEVNTVPGMTDHSLVPMAAREAGLSFQQLVLKLLEMAVEKGVINV